MNVGIETLANATFVIPDGRLDFAAAPAFQEQVERLIAQLGKTPTSLIIDCAGLSYVSSAGLRAILLATRAAQRAGISFALCALQPPVREVFDLSGFSQIIAVHIDRAAALANAQPRPA
jgi:anti-anti-sigma factor